MVVKLRELSREKFVAAPLLYKENDMNEKLSLRGRFHVKLVDKDGNVKADLSGPNGITDVGLNNILDVMFGAVAGTATWYLGLINNAGFSALAAADTMASHAGWAEATNYSEATRVEWTEGTAAARSITNAVTVDFSINATVTINGIFVTSVNTKSGTTGILWATASFSSPVSASNGDLVKISYTVSG